MRLPLFETSTTPGFDTGPRSIGAVKVLRISVTDRCNFRCVYCMPADGVAWLPREQILSFEEIADIVRAAIEIHGIRRFKLTGGEPTVRHNVVDLVRMLRRIDGIEDLSMTTNGFALESLALPLKESGLDRLTISIDSLDADRFRRVTRTGDLRTVLRGLHRALDAGFRHTKINCVTMRGTNDDEFAAFATLARELPVTVRFIEYMPLGDSALIEAGNRFAEEVGPQGAIRFRATAHNVTQAGAKVATEEMGPAGGCGAQLRGDVFVSESEVREAIETTHGPLAPIEPMTAADVGPAVVYRFADHADARGLVGFISAMSSPFCATCNRLRLTATGVLRSCLFEGGEVDLKPILRNSGSAQAIARAMEDCVRLKPDVHSVHGNEQMSRIGG